MHSIDITTQHSDRHEGRSGEDGGWFKLTEVACNGSRLLLQPTMTPWPTQPLATLPSLWPQAAAASRPTQLPTPRPQARPSKSPPLPTRMTGGPTKRQPTRSPRICMCRSAHSTCRSTKSCCGPERIASVATPHCRGCASVSSVLRSKSTAWRTLISARESANACSH
jgi:hypothetical protein